MNQSVSVKSSDAWEVHRHIKIPGLVHQADAMMLESKIGSQSGVRAVTSEVTHHRLTIKYDVRVANYTAVIELLEQLGFPPLDSWFQRRKQAWYEFTESNARDNANLPPPACCNKPPK